MLGLTFDEVYPIAVQALVHAYRLVNDPAHDGRAENRARTGGHLVLMNERREYLLCPIGLPAMTPARPESLANARCLWRNRHAGLVASSQLIKGAIERCPGAIITGRPKHPLERRRILSFDGFLSGMANEAYCLTLAATFRWMTKRRVRHVGLTTHNSFLEPLLEAMQI